MKNEIAKSEKKPETIKSLLSGDEFRKQVALALPRHLDADRFVRIALTAMTRTPNLAQCDHASFFNALLTLSQFGLEPDGRNAHLIPFENRKRNCVECQLIIDYKGLVDLAMRSGLIANIHADKICEADVFEFDRGEIKTHKVDFRKPRGMAYAYYCLVRFKDGSEKCEVMSKEDVESIRARSRAKDSGPWVSDFDEMGKKTCFRRLSKWLQLSSEFRDALDKDDDALEERHFENAKQVETATIQAPNFSKETVQETAINYEVTHQPCSPLDLDDQLPGMQHQAEDASQFEPDTPQKRLLMVLADASVKEFDFIEVLKKFAPKLVGRAKLISELSDEAAEQALKDIDALIQEVNK